MLGSRYKCCSSVQATMRRARLLVLRMTPAEQQSVALLVESMHVPAGQCGHMVVKPHQIWMPSYNTDNSGPWPS